MPEARVSPDAPSVSVVIPTRNRWNTLALALASALAQEDTVVEVIVVDEASTDATSRALTAVSKFEPRLRVLRHDQPQGLAAARNAGLREARGEWVAFLDDDDFWHPAKLQRQLTAALHARADWVIGGAVYVDAALRPFHVAGTSGATDRLHDINSVPAGGSGVVARRALLLELGGFDENLWAFEDWDCWLRLQRRGNSAVTPEAVTAYRIAAGSMSHSVDPMVKALPQMAERHPELRLDGQPSQLAHGTYFALQHARSGRRRDAVAVLLRLRPRRVHFLLRAVWVASTGTAWNRPTWARTRRARRELAAASSWISATIEAGAELERTAAAETRS